MVKERQCGLHRAAVLGRTFQAKRDSNTGQRKRTQTSTNQQLTKHRSEHEQQRVEMIDRRVELDMLRKREDGLLRNQQMNVSAEGKLVQRSSRFAQASDHGHLGQCGKFTHGADAPQSKRLRFRLAR